MSPRVLVRASVLAAVLGAVALFFAIGMRRVPPPAPAPPASQAVR
jgi:hypothetical protein